MASAGHDEGQMPKQESFPPDQKTITKQIQAIIMSHKTREGLPLENLSPLYEAIHGTPIPYSQLGYQSLLDMLKEADFAEAVKIGTNVHPNIHLVLLRCVSPSELWVKRTQEVSIRREEQGKIEGQKEDGLENGPGEEQREEVKKGILDILRCGNQNADFLWLNHLFFEKYGQTIKPERDFGCRYKAMFSTFFSDEVMIVETAYRTWLTLKKKCVPSDVDIPLQEAPPVRDPPPPPEKDVDFLIKHPSFFFLSPTQRLPEDMKKALLSSAPNRRSSKKKVQPKKEPMSEAMKDHYHAVVDPPEYSHKGKLPMEDLAVAVFEKEGGTWQTVPAPRIHKTIRRALDLTRASFPSVDLLKVFMLSDNFKVHHIHQNTKALVMKAADGVIKKPPLEEIFVVGLEDRFTRASLPTPPRHSQPTRALDVSVTQSYSPHLFYFVLGENAEILRKLETEMKEYYEEEEESEGLVIPLDVLKRTTNIPVSAPYKGKGYRRAEVKEIYDDGTAKLLFVDSGEVCVTQEPRDIRYLLRKFFDAISAQAIQAGITTVKPPNGDTWSEGTKRAFADMASHPIPGSPGTAWMCVGGDGGRGGVVGVSEIFRQTGEGETDGIMIVDTLIREGLAVEDSYEYEVEDVREEDGESAGVKVTELEPEGEIQEEPENRKVRFAAPSD